jgi:hypothetical protein
MLNRKLKLNTSQVPDSYNSLRLNGNWRDDIIVDLERIAHHEFIDTHGHTAPWLFPYVFSYSQLVAGNSGDHLRFKDGGTGAHKEARTARRNLLGRAICREIAEQYLDIWSFWFVDDALRGNMPDPLRHLEVQRSPGNGDAPDLLGVQHSGRPVFLEAKGHGGRYAYSFNHSTWQSWADQIRKNVVVRRGNVSVKVKGFVIATRLCEESGPPSTKRPDVRILDPSSPGDIEPDSEFRLDLSRAVVANHYASVLTCLRLNQVAQVLKSGEPREESFGIRIPLWTCQVGELLGKRFAGFHLPRFGYAELPTENPLNHSSQSLFPPLQRDKVFFGIQYKRLRGLQSVVRSGIGNSGLNSTLLQPVEVGPTEEEDFSVLGDGTVLGSPTHFEYTSESFEL